MATIPNGTRFIGIAETVNLVERKTATQNAQTEPYTIEDIAAYVGGGGGGQLTPDELAAVQGSNEPSADNVFATINDLAPLMVEITYDELVLLRDTSELVPGTRYRITDFVTIVDFVDVISAGNQFDIIVVADSANTLNENASAIRNDLDSYFPDYTNFGSWELKYSLDNDKIKYNWADLLGKGVIYYMKDDNNNEAYYDFKNILFARYSITSVDINSNADNVKQFLQYDNIAFSGAYFGFYTRYAIANTEQAPYGSAIVDGSDRDFYYTFTNLVGDELTYGTPIDQSTFILSSGFPDTDSINTGIVYTFGNIVIASNNKIGPLYTKIVIDDIENQSRQLNNIILCTSTFSNEGETNAINGNIFGKDCYNMTFFGAKLFSNVFANDCNSNVFGSNFEFNSFGDEFVLNTIESFCAYNVFGQRFNYNSAGRDFTYNVFGYNCNQNVFYEGFNSNRIGNLFASNSFFQACGYNNIGDGVYTFNAGINFSNNTIGNNCNTINAQDNIVGNIIGGKAYNIDLRGDFGVGQFKPSFIFTNGIIANITFNLGDAYALFAEPVKQITIEPSFNANEFIITGKVDAATTLTYDYMP